MQNRSHERLKARTDKQGSINCCKIRRLGGPMRPIFLFSARAAGPTVSSRLHQRSRPSFGASHGFNSFQASCLPGVRFASARDGLPSGWKVFGFGGAVVGAAILAHKPIYAHDQLVGNISHGTHMQTSMSIGVGVHHVVQVPSNDNDALSPFVRRYLLRVYGYLAGSIGLTVGSALIFFSKGWTAAIVGYVGPTAFLVVGAIGGVGALCCAVMPSMRRHRFAKHVAFASFTLIEGLVLSPFLGPLAAASPGVLISAGVYSAAVMGGLSALALFDGRRRSYLGWERPLGIGMCALGASYLIQAFLPLHRSTSHLLQDVTLYSGLALFSGLGTLLREKHDSHSLQCSWTRRRS